MLVDYHDFIMNLKNEGNTYTHISEELERVYGYKVSRQAITKYINKQGIKKLDIKDYLSEEEIEKVYEFSSARKAHEYLLSRGHTIGYKKVITLRNQRMDR